jgi:AcrR family transcriptional regulator
VTERPVTQRGRSDGPRTRGGWTPAGTAARRRVAQAERSTSRGQRTRQQILDAARVVFGRVGYLDAGIDDIVAEAGLARGSFYTYFPSKLDVFKVLAAEVGEAIAGAVTQEPGERSLDPVAALDRSNRRYLDAYRRNAAIYGLIEQTAGIDPELRQLRQHYRELHVERVAARIRSWRRRGLAAAAVDPATAAAALVSMTSNFCYWWHVLGEQHDEETAAATLTALWAGSLGLSSGSGRLADARRSAGQPAAMTGPGQDPPEVT